MNFCEDLFQSLLSLQNFRRHVGSDCDVTKFTSGQESRLLPWQVSLSGQFERLGLNNERMVLCDLPSETISGSGLILWFLTPVSRVGHIELIRTKHWCQFRRNSPPPPKHWRQFRNYPHPPPSHPHTQQQQQQKTTVARIHVSNATFP